MDPTLLTILLLLVFATAIALIQARKRDQCLTEFSGFPITMIEKDGDITWGELDVLSSGLEIRYKEPIVAPEGHLERSYLYYKDQYDTMDGLYRYPGGLSEEERARRAEIIQRTANPSFARRLLRQMRNWVGMVRDALMQSVGMLIGVAKTRRPGSTILGTQEQNLRAISGEVIGHAGNAYDPLLERHLFKQVVLEVTRGGKTRKVCGWLKDYTAEFIELVDAYVNTNAAPLPVRTYSTTTENTAVTLEVADDILTISNTSDKVLNIQAVESADWQRAVGCILPPELSIRIPLPAGKDPSSVYARICSIERIDLVVPRAHAIVRFGADGTDAHLSEGAPADDQLSLPAAETNSDEPRVAEEQESLSRPPSA